MSKASTYEAKTEQLILPILERMQFELKGALQSTIVKRWHVR